jgi:hypothetical protein
MRLAAARFSVKVRQRPPTRLAHRASRDIFIAERVNRLSHADGGRRGSADGEQDFRGEAERSVRHFVLAAGGQAGVDLRGQPQFGGAVCLS